MSRLSLLREFASVLAVPLLLFATLAAEAAEPSVELPLRRTTLQHAGNPPHPIYSVAVRIGSTLVETGVDTGSVGLRVLPNIVKPGDAQPGEQPETYGYTSGVKLTGPIGSAKIAFGNRSGEARLQLIREVGCFPRQPKCPAVEVGGQEHYRLMGQGIPNAGFPAIAGLGFPKAGDHGTGNPLIEIGVERYLVELPRTANAVGRLVLDPPAAETKGFTELPNSDEAFGSGDVNSVPGCLVNLAQHQRICGTLLLDSGAPGIRASVPGAQNAAWPVDTPGRIVFGDGHGNELASEDFTAGLVHFGHVIISAAPPNQARATISVGVTPYLAFSVLYDAKRRGIALRPREKTNGAPVGSAR